jgi:hypothetical protein
LNGQVPLSNTESFQFVASKTRGDSHKLNTQFSSKDIRFNSFFIRTARIYKQLPTDTRNSSPIEFTATLHQLDLNMHLTTTKDKT